jgi:heme-degrading monooxygenase HmoA
VSGEDAPQSFHLVQVNVARLIAPLDSEQLRPFVERLERVNAAADASPGFVWRLQTEDGDATGVRVFDDPEIIVNLSVWDSLEALRSFAYNERQHREVLRRRREFFERAHQESVALWWITAGCMPTVADAEQRLLLLRALGPTAESFTFKRHYPPPDAAAAPVDDDRELCPAP